MYEGSLTPRTNRESWTQQVTIIDPDNGDLWDLVGNGITTIEVEIRRITGRSGGSMVPYYDSCGANSNGGPLLTASLANGAVTIVTVGVFQFYFSETQMSSLRAETYGVGCTISNGVDTKQILRCRLPILTGWVT